MDRQKLIDALNNLDEKADTYSEEIEDKKELEKDYDLLFNFIINKTRDEEEAERTEAELEDLGSRLYNFRKMNN